MASKSPSDEPMTFEAACKAVPQDIHEHITTKMSHILPEKQHDLLLYIIANYPDIINRRKRVRTVVKDFYRVDPEADGEEYDETNAEEYYETEIEEPDNDASWKLHSGRGLLRELRRTLLKHRDDVMDKDIIITLGEESKPYRLHVYRRETESEWVIDQPKPDIPEQEASPILPAAAQQGAEKNTGVFEIFNSLRDARVLVKIKECKGIIKFSITGLDQTREWNDSLEAALKNGAKVEILLSHPECALVKLRSRAIGSDVTRLARETRDALKRLRSLGNLTVRITSEFAPISYCQLNELIYFGMYWSHVSAGGGRVFLLDAGSDIGKFLTEQYDKLWMKAQLDDLTGDVPEPDSFHKQFHANFLSEVET